MVFRFRFKFSALILLGLDLSSPLEKLPIFVIARSEATKQSQPEIATRSTQVILSAPLTMTENTINRQLMN